MTNYDMSFTGNIFIALKLKRYVLDASKLGFPTGTL